MGNCTNRPRNDLDSGLAALKDSRHVMMRRSSRRGAEMQENGSFYRPRHESSMVSGLSQITLEVTSKTNNFESHPISDLNGTGHPNEITILPISDDRKMHSESETSTDAALEVRAEPEDIDYDQDYDQENKTETAFETLGQIDDPRQHVEPAIDIALKVRGESEDIAHCQGKETENSAIETIEQIDDSRRYVEQ